LELADAALGDAPVNVGSDAAPDSDLPVIPADGATDAPADSPTLGFCASLPAAPKLCTDFDTGSFSTSFASVTVSSAATLGADSHAFTSPPSSLLATLPLAAQSNDVAFVAQTFTGTASSVVYAFDLRVDAWPTGGKVAVVATVVIDDGLATEHSLRFFVTDTSAGVEEVFVSGTTQYLDHALTSHPLLGTWTRVELDIDLAGRTCSASLGGAPALANAPLASTWGPGTPEVHLGISFVSAQSAAWAARFDNVVFDWR
jgi:hypothetical protein